MYPKVLFPFIMAIIFSRPVILLIFLVYGQIIVETNALQQLTTREESPLLNYLKATGLNLGLLINFGSALIREGIFRVVNGLPE